jgi:pimeloyl-ACP methyl ester carboxylesterase
MRDLAGRRLICMAALLTCLLAGCSAGGSTSAAPAKAAPKPAATTLASPQVQPSSRCQGAGPAARLMTLRTGDGVALSAAEVGGGTRGVVLVHELGDTGLCGWWPFATYLAGRGYRVMLFDHRCVGESGCPASMATTPLTSDIDAAAGRLRTDGATSIVLVGGSQGASEVLIAGARPQPGVTAVVSLSPDENETDLGTDPATADRAAPLLRLPVLFAVAPDDRYVAVGDVRALYNATASAHKRLDVVSSEPGQHGWYLTSPVGGDPPFPPYASKVLAFLHTYTS